MLKAAKLKFNERKFYTILKDLNFQDEDLELRLKDLSCGQMTKVGIAKVLATVSDVLILDEPTNHLDIDAREWLEDYLCDLDKPLLLVSHDRYFLDTIVNKIFEIEDATLTKYNGNYTAYLEAKTKQFELDVARHSQEQKEIARLKESAYIKLVWARRGGSHQLARTGHSMEKRAERLEKVAIAEPKDKTEKMKIKFESERSEKSIYFCENLTKEYEHRVLFNGLNLNIERGDKIALIGPNGHGKTTLLDIITRKVEPTSGISYLNPSVVLGYYDQQQKFDDESRTLLEELQITYPAINEGALRRSLGNVLFRKDDVFKKIACLSNGEKARLLLTKLMLSNPNFLIFDEPTNNLDIVSTDIFLDTLKEYKGTVLLVSHDRYFIDQLCSSTWYLADKHVITFPGNYSKFKHHTMFEQDSKS